MLTWEGRKYEFVAESTWRTRYAVRSGEQTILTVQGKPGGKHPVVARFDDPNLDAGLLFFASWLVRDIARQQSSAAAGSSG